MTVLYIIGIILLLIPVWIIYPTSVLGNKRKPKGKLILINNHMTMADPFLLAAHHNRQVYFLAKRELKDSSPFLKFILKRLGVVSIERGKPDLNAIRGILKLIECGKTIGIYPEGTRNRKSDQINNVKSGSAMFALKSDTPLVPVIIWKRPKKFKKNIMLTGDPIDWGNLANQKIDTEILNAADEIIYNEMVKLQKLVKYYAALRGATKKQFKAKLNNPHIKIKDIYNGIFDGKE